MTHGEAMAENRKLEEELRQMAMENARLKTELAAVRPGASSDAGAKACATKPAMRNGSEVELDFDGVVIRLKGRVAEHFAVARGVPCENLPGGC